MPSIHQFVAGFSNGDAISNEALVMRDIFRSWGCESAIFSESHRVLPELRKQAGDAAECAARCRPDDVVLLHLSIGSDVNDIFAALKCRKVILYHNITPAHFFTMVNPQTARELARGREQARRLAGSAELNMADSAFNAAELRALGYRDPCVLPLVLDLEKLTGSVDRKTLRRFNDGKTNVLFVGRCAPNKRIEDVLLAFYYYQRFVDANSRLIHVGSFSGTERYYYLMLAQAQELGLSDVHFAGSVPQAQLNAYFRVSRLFLCMSEHEGFCIPLLESMVHDVPILAYAAAAIPETLDGAGVLCRKRQFDLIAEMMGRLNRDGALRTAVLHGQRERIERYRGLDLARSLRARLEPLLEGVRP